MGAKAWENGPKEYLRVFSEAEYTWDRGLGFSPASALFWEDKAGLRTCKNETKEENKMLGRILDIMAREFYLLQEAIYSSGQTMINYYNRTRI